MATTEIAALNGLYAAMDRMAAEPIDLRHAVSAGIGVSLNGGLCVSVNGGRELSGAPTAATAVCTLKAPQRRRLSRGWRPVRRTSTPPGALSWPAGST